MARQWPGPCRPDRTGSRGWRLADKRRGESTNFPANRRRGTCGSAQRRGLAKSVWQAGCALASREQNLEGGEGDAHAARPKNLGIIVSLVGFSECAKAEETKKSRVLTRTRNRMI